MGGEEDLGYRIAENDNMRGAFSITGRGQVAMLVQYAFLYMFSIVKDLSTIQNRESTICSYLWAEPVL